MSPGKVRAAMTSWWAWCAYLAIVVSVYRNVTVWWLQWPIVIGGTCLYVAFAAVQVTQLMSAGIPMYFGSVSTQAQRWRILKSAVAAYFMTVFEFALFYLIISTADDKAFNVGVLDLSSAVYFSLVTMATVGYGDIVPADLLARVFVCLEISIGLGFTVLLFAMLANIRIEQPGPTDGAQEVRKG